MRSKWELTGMETRWGRFLVGDYLWSAGAVWRYALAVALMAAALLVRWALFPLIGEDAPYMFVFPAITLAAVLGGWGPALLVSIIGTLATETLFVGDLGIYPNGPTILRMLMILLSGALLASIGYGLRVLQIRAQTTAGAAQAEAAARTRVEAALRESEARVRATIENAGVGILEVDPEDRFIAANERICRMLGYRREELLRMTVHDLTYPDDQTRSDELNAQVHAGQIDHASYEKRYRTREGRTLWVNVTVSAVRDDAGRYLRGIGVIEDITEQREARQQLLRAKQEWERTFDSVPDLITILDRDHHILRVNRAMARRLGMTPEQCAGQICHECIHGRTTRPGLCPHDLLLADGKEHSAEVYEERLGGSFLVTTAPLVDEEGNPVGSVHVARDITQQKRAEEALKRFNEELEARVAERTAQLQAVVEELQRSNEDLERFAYISSHDLQEPLRMIGGYVGLLAHQYKDKLDEKAATYIRYAEEGAVRMSHLIKDLLTYSRVNTESKSPQPVPAERALKLALENLRAAVTDAGAEIIHDAMPMVWADEIQLAQVFQNLIGNALKFRKDGVTPRVRVSAAQTGGEVVFSICDNGIGIERSYFDQIFLPFKRLHADRGKYPGSGIGLAIVKRIVERHHGRVWVESAPGDGTTFRFTLPATSCIISSHDGK